MFPVDKKRSPRKKVADKNVLIPWYPISYLTIASYGFIFLGAYGSLPDAAIWWCLRIGGGGVRTSLVGRDNSKCVKLVANIKIMKSENESKNENESENESENENKSENESVNE